jgi:tetratricopeptide (TPR) repeat protein
MFIINLRRLRQLFLLLLFTCVVTTNQLFAQKELTISQWQSDLHHLQKKIHADYRHLFHAITTKQFDSAVAVFRKNIPHFSRTEIIVGFARLLAQFKIGHTGLGFCDSETGRFLFHYYPITLYSFTDGLFIKSAHAQYVDAIGGRVTKIGNDPVGLALQKMREVIPCENEQHFRSNLQYYFRLPEILHALKITETAQAVVLTYSKDGKEKHITIKAEEPPVDFWHGERQLPDGWIDAYPGFHSPRAPLWLKEPNKLRYDEYLAEPKIYYVRHSAVVDEPGETMAAYFKRVFDFIDSHDVDKFVLDIRSNPGGNNYLNKPVITGIVQAKKINRYGHLFVITGATTFSAAQNLSNELEKYTEAIFVGEPTGENVNFWGDVKTEILPNSKLGVVLSWLWWQNMDPRDKRPWKAPDLAVGMSFENYRNGFDSALQVITYHTIESRIEDRVEKFAVAGKTEEAVMIAEKYIHHPFHRYVRNELESRLNDKAYSWVLREMPAEASRLFELNLRLFPGSANAHDSYAECLWKLGKKDEAIRHYRMAISKDPGGETAENSRKMLYMLLGNR